MFYQFLRTYWFAFLLPGIIVILSFLLKYAVGPFWQYADPSYIYLLNSLNLVKGIPSTYIDHPGTPLQILGQMVIVILNIGHSTANTINNVLINPEYYLNAINMVLLVLIPLTSILLGIYTYRKTKDIITVFLSQLPNVLLLTLKTHIYNHPVVPPVYSNINDEPLLLVITNLFNILLLKLFFSKTNKEENFTILALGFICGLGVACKLTFLPLLMLPLIVSRWSIKPGFLIVTIISFVLWTLPFISLYPKLWGWITELFTHTGIYGNGNQGVINIHDYLMSWELILQQFWFFILLALCALMISSIQIVKRQFNRNVLFIWAISLTVLVQFVVVAKHFDEHYLVVAINSIGPLFVLFYLYQFNKNTLIKNLICILIALSVIQASITTVIYASQLAEHTKEIVDFNNMIHVKYPNSIYLGSYIEAPIRNSEYALFMGNDSNGGGEKEELSRLYPNSYSFYSDSRDIDGTCTNGIYNFKGPVWADDLLAQYPSVIFINSGYDFADSPYIVKPLEEGKYSKAYLLVGSTEKAANMFFNAAVQEIQKGNYRQAFALALRSHQLNYQPKEKVEYLLSLIYFQIKH